MTQFSMLALVIAIIATVILYLLSRRKENNWLIKAKIVIGVVGILEFFILTLSDYAKGRSMKMHIILVILSFILIITSIIELYITKNKALIIAAAKDIPEQFSNESEQSAEPVENGSAIPTQITVEPFKEAPIEMNAAKPQSVEM